MLLPAAIVLTLWLLPMLPVTRINWPRWWRALAFLACGLFLLVGPYIAIKGGLGTKPGIARVLGLSPVGPLGLEREHPLPADQSTAETYKLATIRMVKAFKAAVTPPLFAMGVFGFVLAAFQGSRISVLDVPGHLAGHLGRRAGALHATGRIPHDPAWTDPGHDPHDGGGPRAHMAMGRRRYPADGWAGRTNACDRARPCGPPCSSPSWSMPNVRALGPRTPVRFGVCRSTGRWIAGHSDLTPTTCWT